MLGLVPEAVLEEASWEGSRVGAGPPRVAWEGRQPPACRGSPDRLIWAASILCNGWHERRPGRLGRVPGQLFSGRGTGGVPVRGCCPSCVMLPDPQHLIVLGRPGGGEALL